MKGSPTIYTTLLFIWIIFLFTACGNIEGLFPKPTETITDEIAYEQEREILSELKSDFEKEKQIEQVDFAGQPGPLGLIHIQKHGEYGGQTYLATFYYHTEGYLRTLDIDAMAGNESYRFYFHEDNIYIVNGEDASEYVCVKGQVYSLEGKTQVGAELNQFYKGLMASLGEGLFSGYDIGLYPHGYMDPHETPYCDIYLVMVETKMAD